MWFYYDEDAFCREAASMSEVLDWLYILWELVPAERDWRPKYIATKSFKVQYGLYEFFRATVDWKAKTVTVERIPE